MKNWPLWPGNVSDELRRYLLIEGVIGVGFRVSGVSKPRGQKESFQIYELWAWFAQL